MRLNSLACKSLPGAPMPLFRAPIVHQAQLWTQVVGIKCLLLLVMRRFLPKFSREFEHKSATYSSNSLTYSNNSLTYSNNSLTYSNNSLTYSNNSATYYNQLR